MNTYEFDVLGISEINLDTTKPSVQEEIRGPVMCSKGLNLTMSSSPVSAQNKYKPGGVMMFTTGRINGRKVTNFQDRLGRWVGTSFLGREGKWKHILTLYRPCSKPKKAHLLRGRPQRMLNRNMLLRNYMANTVSQGRHF